METVGNQWKPLETNQKPLGVGLVSPSVSEAHNQMMQSDG